MEGFKNKILNEGIKVTENDNGITYAILRVLGEESDAFKGDFNSLTKDRKRLILDLTEKIQVKDAEWNLAKIEDKYYTKHNIPSLREKSYNLRNHVMPNQFLTISESDYQTLFWEISNDTQAELSDVKKEFVGPPEAPREEKVTEVEDKEVQEIVEVQSELSLSDKVMSLAEWKELITFLKEQLLEDPQGEYILDDTSKKYVLKYDLWDMNEHVETIEAYLNEEYKS